MSRAAVLFDLDDTLYPERSFVEGGLDAVARHAKKQGWVAAEDAARERLQSILARDGRGRVFDTFLEEIGGGEAHVQELLHVYRTHRPVLRAYDDVAPALACLRSAGVPTAIVTDGLASVQNRKIEALGLEELVDCVVCTGDLAPAHAKPSPTPFLVALSRIRAGAGGSAYVGNDARKDFLGPRRLGMTAIHLRRPDVAQADPPTAEHAAHLAITGLGELGALRELIPLWRQAS